jgi:CRP-like cAMP-binding protein
MTPKKEDLTFDPKEFLSRIGAGRTNIKFAADDVIFAQGDTAAAVYYLQDGNAKITVTSENGKEAVLAIIGPGDFSARAA